MTTLTSKFRLGLFALVLPALLVMTSAAHAQLEFLSKIADFSSLNPTGLNDLFQRVTNGSVHQVTFRGTVSTSGGGGAGPIFGKSGTSVPVTAYVIVDTAEPIGPTQTYLETSTLGMMTLLQDFVGYTEDQILGIYIVIGTGTPKEFGYLNAVGLSPKLSGTTLNQFILQGSTQAQLWLNDDLSEGAPDAGNFTLETDGGPSFGGSEIQIGGTSSGMGSTLEQSTQIFIDDGAGGNFALGDLTSVEVEDLSLSLANFLKDKASARRLADRTKAKLAKLKVRAKKMGLRPGKSRPYKSTQKKFKKVKALLKKLGVPY